MVANFQHEAEKVIELLPDEFSSHQFLKLYATSFPLSYFELMEEYKEVRLAHNQLSNELRRLSEKKQLPIERNGKIKDQNIFGNEDDVAVWQKK